MEIYQKKTNWRVRGTLMYDCCSFIIGLRRLSAKAEILSVGESHPEIIGRLDKLTLFRFPFSQNRKIIDLHCAGVSESRSSVYINIKHTRMDWSFLLLISSIKHQGQCFPLLLTYPSAKFRISTPNRFSKTCDVNMRSCKFLRQIFHLKKLA